MVKILYRRVLDLRVLPFVSPVPPESHFLRGQTAASEAADTNRFACPLPKLSAGCSQNGLAFAARDAHYPAATCGGAELDGKLSYFPS